MYELTIKPSGDLVDSTTWEEFAEMVINLAKALNGVMILDLANVNRIASNYIGTIITAHKQARQGSRLRLINVRGRLYELLGVLRLTEMFEVEPMK